MYGMGQMLANQPVWTPFSELGRGLQSGLSEGVKAQQAHAALLQNRLAEQKLKYQPGLMQAQIAHLGAPSIGGIAGQWKQLEQYRQQFGENSPQYQQLYNALMSQQHLAAQRGNYYSALARTIGQRYSPTQQRQQVIAQLTQMGYPVSTINTLNDQQRAAIVQKNIPYNAYLAATGGAQLTQGATPAVPSGVPSRGLGGVIQPQVSPTLSPRGSGLQTSPTTLPAPNATLPPAAIPSAVPDKRLQKLTDQQGQEAQSAIFKTTTTTDQQNRLAAATRATPSLEIMAQNAPLALQYSGILGKSKKLADKLRQDNAPAYLAYKQYKQAQAVAEQDTAMALGIHATDKAFNAYRPLFNIDTWDVTPQQAQALFNNMGKIVHSEALQNTLTLQQQRQRLQRGAPVQIPTGQAQGVVKIRAPNGTIHSIPANEAQAALAAGGTRIG